VRGSPYSNRKPYLSAVSARGPLPTMFKPTLFSRARSINLNLRAWRRDARAISLGIHESAQYAANQYRDILQAAAITQSMSRKTNCWDNAPMESFFGTLKTELVHPREYPDRTTARRELFAYIEGYYNRARIHSAIGYITPQQAEAEAA